MADYTNQWRELIQILSRRDIVPSWAIALIGAVVGGFLSLGFQKLNEHFIKKRLASAAVREFVVCCWELTLMWQRLMDRADTVERIHQEHTSRIAFDNYQYARNKPDVFFDPAFICDTEELYHCFRRVAAVADDTMKLVLLINAFRRTFQEKVFNKKLKWRVLRKVSPATVRDELDDLAHGRREPDG